MTKGHGFAIVVLLLVVWIVCASSAHAADKAPATKVTKSLEIDADVYSPTFGEPIDAQAGGQE
jgi:hypothetical protein